PPAAGLFLYCQSSLPVSGWMPTTPDWLPSSATYIGVPWNVALSGEEYPHPAPTGPTSAFQTTAPSASLSATTAAFGPHGVQITLSPSTKTESLYAHIGTCPPNSSR